MIVERKCLSCRLSAENPDLTPDQRIEAATQTGGETPRLCLAHPPQWVAIPTPQGMMMTVMHPTVGVRSISCADYEPEFLNG